MKDKDSEIIEKASEAIADAFGVSVDEARAEILDVRKRLPVIRACMKAHGMTFNEAEAFTDERLMN